MTDIEIARNTVLSDIKIVAEKLNIGEDDLVLYGKYKAKIKESIEGENQGKLILVTATNPTPMGEGKTTVSIGLADGLNKLKKKVALALREPSMGPVFGMKGGKSWDLTILLPPTGSISDSSGGGMQGNQALSML